MRRLPSERLDQARRALGLIDTNVWLPLISRGAMLIARADDGGETRAQVGASVTRFLDALRPRN